MLIPEFEDEETRDAFISKCEHVAKHLLELGRTLREGDFEEATTEFMCFVQESRDIEEAMALNVALGLVEGRVEVPAPRPPFSDN